MRFRLHLAIDDEVVGNINMDCRAAEKKIVFRMQNRALVLLETHITAIMRPPPSASLTCDDTQFTIATTLSHSTRPYFRCSQVTQANVLSLTLQTMFPTIPWLTDDRATGGPRLLRKRPRRESTRESFYGSSSSLAPSFPMVNAAFDAAFHYRVQHSIECQLDGTAPVHHVFALQQPAIDFIGQIQARRPTHFIKLFSFETRGSRKFLVSDIDVFFDKYMQTPPTQRHVYEIIQADMPCHLYFDLEFKPAFNPHVNGDVLVRQLKHLVALQFYRKFGIHVSADKNMVDLVSTAPDKFSRHLVVIAPDGALFVNNLEAGQFVKELMDTFALHADDSGDLSFNVMDQHNQPQSFIDMGVYTRYPIPSSPNASSRVAGIERFGVCGRPSFSRTAFSRDIQSAAYTWTMTRHFSSTR
ncbi:hypothetical protein, variant [Aphanomyces invadans]|uniref:DNA-directed primase/polymerase protein n=1 Tax=Aphanomyces invadans TaxID=157072 RepID=A0A024TWS8_9STRA|nr:hypothetical protein, variant [Aphanomyces invadans]ETV98458.1 hypothetical protein, variant [Aphanomyces invadans]|eukprot:XP_008872655.1 hypothetical protein, variant [Aphanomyces invadans]